MNKTEQLLFNLISLNIINPDCLKSNPSGEKIIGDYIAGYLSKNDIDCQKQPVEDLRENILAVVKSNIKGSNTAKNILFCSHLDTVYAGDMDFNPFLKSGRIFGPGASDAKDSLASMITALIWYSRQKIRNNNLYFLGAISEESRHLGIKGFLKDNKDLAGLLDFCIIGEPTSLNIGIAHKGSIKLEIKATGENAHGAMPGLGINAINMMPELIREIQFKILPSYKNIENAILGNPTLNIGVIRGGQAFNIVPGSCFIEIDRRVLPEEEIDDVIAEFKYAINKLCNKIAGFKAEIVPVEEYILPLHLPEDNFYLDSLNDVCKKYEKNSIKTGLAYATDGGFTSLYSIPTVIFGPGSINVSHKPGEYVEAKELSSACSSFKAFLEKI